MAAAAKPAKPAYELSGWERFKKDVVRDKWLYLLILPGMLFMLIFRYIPIFPFRFKSAIPLMNNIEFIIIT